MPSDRIGCLTMDVAQPAEDEQRFHKLILAVVSLGLGLASLPLIGFFMFGIVAIVTGHLARRRTVGSHASPTAGVMSVIGITLGYSTLILGSAYTISNGSRGGGNTKSQASLATTIALESAINSIYTEYGKLPDVGSRVSTNSPEGLKLPTPAGPRRQIRQRPQLAGDQVPRRQRGQE